MCQLPLIVKSSRLVLQDFDSQLSLSLTAHDDKTTEIKMQDLTLMQIVEGCASSLYHLTPKSD